MPILLGFLRRVNTFIAINVPTGVFAAFFQVFAAVLRHVSWFTTVALACVAKSDESTGHFHSFSTTSSEHLWLIQNVPVNM